MPLFIFSFIMFVSQWALAEIVINNISGASFSEFGLQETTEIWGGVAGPPCSSGGGTCNNCNGGLQPCNERRISGQGYLTITFSSTTASGVPLLTDSNKQTPVSRDTFTPVSANNNVSLSIRWSDICSQGTNGDSSCSSNNRMTLHLGIDGASEGASGNGSLADTQDDSVPINIHIRGMSPDPQGGIVQFKMWPGDEKIWLLLFDEEEDELSGEDGDEEHPLIFPDGFPAFDDTQFKDIRFYYVEGDCSRAVAINNQSDYVSTTIEDVQGSDGVELSTQAFTHSDNYNSAFANSTSYVFISALTDLAGNVGFFSSPSVCHPENHVITPSRVVGLLSDRSREFDCPLSSSYSYASYANSQHLTDRPSFQILQTFYRFRDEKLLPYPFGRFIHNIYYNYSPLLTSLLENYSFLKPLARVCFFPLFIYASLALEIGHILTLFLLMSVMGLFYCFIKYLIKRKFYQI